MIELVLAIITIALVVISLTLNIIILIKNSQKQHVNTNQDESIKEITGLISKDLDDKLSKLRIELNTSLSNFQSSLSTMTKNEFTGQNTQQKQNFDSMIQSITSNLKTFNDTLLNNTTTSENKLENIRTTVEKSIQSLQQDNSKKLDEMRQVVDEKLQKTLDDKLAQSFDMVTKSLQKVYESIGEMQTLASSVGDLKKVLSNVKTRGILGETQLGNILEQILSSEQYDTNVVTKKGSKDPVEFAIKMPGKDNSFIYLPIDAKFPMDTYQTVLDAYETSNSDNVKSAITALNTKIKKFAKDIHDKYIDVPNTTDFGIMFLPIEGLYAEVVKSGVTETLQRDYKIVVAGPTTMAALLNSLQMGFKTLAIQQRSQEVWKILGAIKTEFDNFEEVLTKEDAQMKPAVQELYQWFRQKTEEEFGAFYCKDITHLDWGVIMEKCPGLIADTYTKVMEILTEREVLKL